MTSIDEIADSAQDSATSVAGPTNRPSGWRRAAHALSFSNVSALYVFAVIFVVFALWIPETFLKVDTWKAMIDSQVVTAMAAIGLTIALAAGVFDLAIGAELGFGAILAAWLVSEGGVPVIPAILLTLLAGGLVGVVNGILVVRFKIESFIATLGVSSVLLAMIAWISGSKQMLGLPKSFQTLGTTRWFGFTVAVFIMLAVSLVAWYVMARTPVGRRVYATGGNIEAAKLAGVRTKWVVVGSLITCGAIAAFGGVLVSSRLGTGDPSIGPPYLLAAFSATFLGSTQFRGGRFNIWGTVLAVYVLATGVKGLQLAGAPIWIPNLFNGLALLIAVGAAKHERTAHKAGAIRRMIRRGSAERA
jgi:ribose transport system permease protein